MGDFSANKRVCESFVRELEARGFEVTVYEPEGFEVMEDSVKALRAVTI